jgi:hypothetical protein
VIPLLVDCARNSKGNAFADVVDFDRLKEEEEEEKETTGRDGAKALVVRAATANTTRDPSKIALMLLSLATS